MNTDPTKNNVYANHEFFPGGNVRPAGELATRLDLNFDRLEGEEYQPRQEYVGGDWPGDFPGRLILALSHLERVTDRNAKYLERIVRELPAQFNAQAYLGEVLPGFDEQQLSGHGWLVSGLIEHWKLTGREESLHVAIRITENLFLPLRGRIGTYPRKLEQRVIGGSYGGNIAATIGDWRLSTDIGCAFIALEGLVRVAIETNRDDLKALVCEMFEVFEAIDLIEISAQLHASLSAAGMFLEYHAAFGHAGMLGVARRAYHLFRTTAITENYANYNWFRRPFWTEPCAIVDSFRLALGLWRHTGEAHYLDDAHHIYFNALGFAQKPHGGFGCDNCVGAEASYLETRYFDPVGCCNMRGSVGLAAVVEHIYLRRPDDSLILGFYFDSRAELDFADGHMSLVQETRYPLEGRITLKILTSSVTTEKALHFFVPPWVDWGKIGLKVNGRSAAPAVARDFLIVKALWKAGDEIELSFPIVLRTQPPINQHSLLARYTYRHGPLVLGVYDLHSTRDRTGLREVAPGRYRASGLDGLELYPLNDSYRLSEASAQKDRKRVLFR